MVSRSLKHSNTESINHAILLRLLVLLNKNRELYLVQIECKNKIYLVTRFMDSLITFYCRRLNIFVKVYIQICPCLTSDLTSCDPTSNLTSCLTSDPPRSPLLPWHPTVHTLDTITPHVTLPTAPKSSHLGHTLLTWQHYNILCGKNA